jgi:acetoin utilization deacetylase AcuC-like enzyme
MKVFYNNNYTASKYAFDTTRKSASIAESLKQYPISGAELADPQDYYETAEKYIRQVHSSQYVDDVHSGKGAATSQGFDWDPGLPVMATSHSAGLIAAVTEVLTNGGVAGSLSSGLHHASYNEGAGFCTFNGLAVSANYALDMGFKSIAIVDFDAHAGGGTYDIIGRVMPDSVKQYDVVVSPFDTYKIRPNDKQSILNVLPSGFSEYDYINSMRACLEKISYDLRPDLIIYNAGMDPYNAGVARHALAYREELMAEWQQQLGVPLVFGLAGGYTWGGVSKESLTNLHRLTIRAFAEIN